MDDWEYGGDGQMGDRPRHFSALPTRNPGHDQKMTALHITFNTNQFVRTRTHASQQIYELGHHVHRVMEEWYKWVAAVEPDRVQGEAVTWRAQLEGSMQGQRLHAHAIIRMPHTTTVDLAETIKNLNTFARRDGSSICYIHVTLLYTDEAIERYVDKDTKRYDKKLPGPGEQVVFSKTRSWEREGSGPRLRLVFPADDSVFFGDDDDVYDDAGPEGEGPEGEGPEGRQEGEGPEGRQEGEGPEGRQEGEGPEERAPPRRQREAPRTRAQVDRENRARLRAIRDRKAAIQHERMRAARLNQYRPGALTRSQVTQQGDARAFAARALLMQQPLHRGTMAVLQDMRPDVRGGTRLLQSGALLGPGWPVPPNDPVRLRWVTEDGLLRVEIVRMMPPGQHAHRHNIAPVLRPAAGRRPPGQGYK